VTRRQRFLRWARRNPRKAAALAVVLAVVVVAGLIGDDDEDQVGAGPSSSPSSSSPSSSAADGTARVVSVVDGDTIKVAAGGREETVRLIGVNTPETVAPNRPVQCYGPEATEFLTRLLADAEVRLVPDPTQDSRDRYGRLLSYVYKSDELVNRSIVASGSGREYTYRTPYQQRDSFRAAQEEARSSGRGLWGPTCAGGTSASPTPTPTPTPSAVERVPNADLDLPDDVPDPDGSAVYFRSCAQARAAGAAPIRRGQPGYRSGLDGDGDGTACDN
jgi:micrococcal nuclease